MNKIQLKRVPTNWVKIWPELKAIGWSYITPYELLIPKGWHYGCCSCTKKDLLLISPDGKIKVTIGTHDPDYQVFGKHVDGTSDQFIGKQGRTESTGDTDTGQQTEPSTPVPKKKRDNSYNVVITRLP